jgi:hypothetical protein
MACAPTPWCHLLDRTRSGDPQRSVGGPPSPRAKTSYVSPCASGPGDGVGSSVRAETRGVCGAVAWRWPGGIESVYSCHEACRDDWEDTFGHDQITEWTLSDGKRGCIPIPILYVVFAGPKSAAPAGQTSDCHPGPGFGLLVASTAEAIDASKKAELTPPVTVQVRDWNQAHGHARRLDHLGLRREPPSRSRPRDKRSLQLGAERMRMPFQAADAERADSRSKRHSRGRGWVRERPIRQLPRGGPRRRGIQGGRFRARAVASRARRRRGARERSPGPGRLDGGGSPQSRMATRRSRPRRARRRAPPHRVAPARSGEPAREARDTRGSPGRSRAGGRRRRRHRRMRTVAVAARMRIAPPHQGHSSMSIAKTRRISSAQGRFRRRRRVASSTRRGSSLGASTPSSVGRPSTGHLEDASAPPAGPSAGASLPLEGPSVAGVCGTVSRSLPGRPDPGRWHRGRGSRGSGRGGSGAAGRGPRAAPRARAARRRRGSCRRASGA